MTSLRTVRLYGKLGTKFGRIHRLAVESAAEAIRALCTLRPGFERELMTSRDRGIGYAVFLGKKNLRQEQLVDNAEDREIRIAPILQGAGFGGIFQIILGVVLIAVSILSFGAATVGIAAAFESLMAATGGMALFAFKMGVGLMIGGIVQLLSPQPKGLSARNRPQNEASYTFNGAVNTTAQGGPVPLGYGRMIVGSSVISAGIYSADRL